MIASLQGMNKAPWCKTTHLRTGTLPNPKTGRQDGSACWPMTRIVYETYSCALEGEQSLLRASPAQQGGRRACGHSPHILWEKMHFIIIITLSFHKSFNIFIFLIFPYFYGPEKISSKILSYLCNQLSRMSNDFASLGNIRM